MDFYRVLRPRIFADKMPSTTLVIADYPVGYASGFGETLYNLFSGFPSEKLWSAHPGHIAPAEDKQRAQSIRAAFAVTPALAPNRISLAYYPLLKAQQFQASRDTVRLLAEVVERNSIKNLLVVPVSPWILSAALALHKQYPKLNLVLLRDGRLAGTSRMSPVAILALARRLLREIDRSR